MPRRAGRTLAAILAVVAATCGAAPVRGAAAEYVEGRVLVRWKPGVTAAARAAVRARLGAGVMARTAIDFIDSELLAVPAGAVDSNVVRLARDPRVVWAEPDYVVHASVVPDDSLFARQWALANHGQTGGTPGADIRATAAWDVTTGDSTLLIGVIDTGVDYSHPDIAANIWTNPGEIADNGVDDDGDGYVDDVHGYDFQNNDGDPFDDNGHGTHVAGTIAARGGDRLGVAGVCWRARIVPIKFLGAAGGGSMSGAVLALQYALRIGVSVTNNSWGGGGSSRALSDAVDAVGAAGQLLVAAAGNAGSDNDVVPTYPASFTRPWVIAVAATDADDRLAPFSNFGATSVDFAAPGVDILSLAPGGRWRLLSGTSMAAPHATGVAGLLWSRFPGMGAAEVKARMVASVDTFAWLAGTSATGGRLNALVTVADRDSTPPGAITDLAVAAPGSDFLTLVWTATGDDSSAGRATSYDLRVATAPIITFADFAAARVVGGPTPNSAGAAETIEVSGLSSSTTYWCALRARDEWNNSGPVSNTATGLTLPPPVIALHPDSVTASVEVGGVATRALSIANPGQGTLDWSAPLPILAFAAQTAASAVITPKGAPGPSGDAVALGRGGPDAAGYRWIDSDQPGGPVFAWVDAATRGTPLPMTGDDEMSFPLELGFVFPFYGASHTQVRVCTNGFIAFEDVPPQFANQPLPGMGAPRGIVAPFWDDLDFGGVTRVWTLAEPGRFTVEWSGVSRYATGGPYTFEVVLEATGELRFQYLAMGPPVNDATVGMQNAERTAGLNVVFDAAYVHDRLAVRLASLPQWLTVTPTSGRVGAGAWQDVTLEFSGTGLLAGTLRGEVRVLSNDPARPGVEVPVRVDVRGAPDLAVRPAALDFGDVIVGTTAVRSFTVLDAGTDTLQVSGITSGDPRVSVPGGAFALAPRASRLLSVSFTPGAPDTLDTSVVIASDDPDRPSADVPLSGRAVPAPRVVVAPEAFALTLAGDSARVDTLRVRNDGAGPYTFTVETLPPDGADARPAAPSAPFSSLAAGGPDHHGTTWRDSDAPGGPAFAWEDIRLTGARLALTGDDARTGPIPIGFDFPYYGAIQRSLRVCTNGWVSFTDSTRVTAANLPLPSAAPGAPENVLAVFWDDLVFGPERRAWVHSTPQRCVIQYQDVPRFGTAEVGRGNTFEIVLTPDGAIEYRYLVVRASVRTSATVGIQDAAREDGLQVVFDAPWLRDSLAVRFRPSLGWLTVDPAQGTVAPGDSLPLGLRFDARGRDAGAVRGTVRLRGDDPTRPVVDVPCALEVTGTPRLVADSTRLDFGPTYPGWPRALAVMLANPGTDTLRLALAGGHDARLSATPAKAAVPPHGTLVVRVTFDPPAPGALADTLWWTSDAPATPRLPVAVTGEALEPPRAAIRPGTLSALAARGTVDTARTRVSRVIVSNIGTGTLHWTASARLGPSVLSRSPIGAEEAKGVPGAPGGLGASGPDAFGYAWMDSDESGGPVFAWVARSAGAVDLPFDADDQTVARTPLPFAFPFYGRAFDHVNVCTNGWLSFTSTKTTYTNGGLPDTGATVPENLVAVFWDDQSFEPVAGNARAWCQAVGGTFVVTWSDVPRVGGGGPNTYQAVLHPNGDIDLQYLTLTGPLTSATVGIQDSARTIGLQVMANAAFVHGGQRVRIARLDPWLVVAPASGAIAPGGADTLDVRMRATDRDSARYAGEVRIASDDPAHPVLSVPCALAVALERAPFALPRAPLSAALGRDTLRVRAGAGTLARPLAAWIGSVSAPANTDDLGGWWFDFDLLEVRAALLALDGSLAPVVEDSARAWVASADTVRIPRAILHEPTPLHGLGSGLDSVRVEAGALLELAWDDPAGVPATSWSVWLSTDGGHAWATLASALAVRAATVRLPATPAARARLEIVGADSVGARWSWLSDTFVLTRPPEVLPLSFGLRPAGANPTLADAVFEVALPREGDVTFEVFDLRGARVWRDIARRLTAGRHLLRWDGRDANGHPGAPGLYLVRATWSGEHAVRRVVRLR